MQRSQVNYLTAKYIDKSTYVYLKKKSSWKKTAMATGGTTMYSTVIVIVNNSLL